MNPYERIVVPTKREIAKFFANTLVSNAIGFGVTKVLSSTFPKTQKFNVAELAGGFVGFVVMSHLEPIIDEKVDSFFDTRISVSVEHTD
jgi:hypothetical protein